jgi:hypothetical protein
MVAKGDECTRRSAKTSSLSFELQAFAVSDACVRISFTCASVKILAVFKALSIALISSRWERRSVSSSFHPPYVIAFNLFSLPCCRCVRSGQD